MHSLSYPFQITSASTLWKYSDPSGDGDFYLTEKLTTVKSPWSGKTFTQKPVKHTMGDVSKELKEDAKADKEAAPKAKKKKAALDPVLAFKVDAGDDHDFEDDSEEEEAQQKTAASVLWKYTDPDGKMFYLEKKQTGAVKSPYSGKSFQGKPERDSLTDISKDLKSETKKASFSFKADADEQEEEQAPAAKEKKEASSPDQWEEANAILEKGEEHPTLKAIKGSYDAVVKAIEETKKANDRLKKLGVGNTEAGTLLVARVVPAIEELAKVARTVAKQMETKFE